MDGAGLKAVDEAGNWSNVSNVCLGLGAGDNLWPFPLNVSAGGLLTIIYRVPENSPLTLLELHRWAFTGCGAGDIWLLHGYPEPGIYRMTYDFYNEATHEYHPSGPYQIILCFDGELDDGGRTEFTQ